MKYLKTGFPGYNLIPATAPLFFLQNMILPLLCDFLKDGRPRVKVTKALFRKEEWQLIANKKKYNYEF